MTLEQALMLVVISLTGWTALSLWVDRRGDRRINRWFAGILLALCLPQMYFYSLTLAPGGWPVLGSLSQALIWAKGPLMLVFVGLAVAQPIRLPGVHFAPFLTVVLATLLLSLPYHWLGMAGALYALVYMGLAARLLVNHRRRLAHIYSEFKNSAYYWLLFVIVAMAAMLAIDFVLVAGYLLQKLYWLDVARILTWCMSIYLVVVAIFSLYRPELFFHERRQLPKPVLTADLDAANSAQAQVQTIVQQVHEEPPANDSAEVAREGRELDTTTAAALAVQLEKLMQEEQLYLRNELSLPMLAEALGVSVHQASELLNLHLNTRFYDYLNGLRLEHACRLLDDTECKLRIVDLAFASGFNNKNSFYRAFRSTLGTTPADYRARQQEPASAPARS
jgi:AraC-like DNA-binding protein